MMALQETKAAVAEAEAEVLFAALALNIIVIRCYTVSSLWFLRFRWEYFLPRHFDSCLYLCTVACSLDISVVDE